MHISDILVASNMNPKYYKFIPIFCEAWKAVTPNTKVNVVLIADEIPEELNDYKSNIILFPPIEDVSTAFISQFIRILYPAVLNSKGGVLITDIDMLPMNSHYFMENIRQFPHDKFICYRNMLQGKKQLPICYNVATSAVWMEIFNVKNVKDITNVLKNEYKKIKYVGVPGRSGWHTDQVMLCQMVMGWNNKTKRFVALKDVNTGFKRLNRVNDIVFDDDLKTKINNGAFSDYHMKRPYIKYKELNDNILKCLVESKSKMVVNRTLTHPKYGAYMTPLVATVLNTTGPVLELGCRDYSTPLLHIICDKQERYLLSVDTSEATLQLFHDLKTENHEFQYVPVFENDLDLNPKPELMDKVGMDKIWGVVFIDTRPFNHRKKDITRFKDIADVIVVYSTEQKFNGYNPLFNKFKYRYDYKRYTTHTAILSDIINVGNFFK